MTQGERIKVLRKEYLHLTLEQFGDKLGVSKVAISRLENGVNSVTSQMFKSICREFSVSELWLHDGEGEPFIQMNRNDEIMAAVGRILADEPDSFRRRWISVMCQLSTDEWELLEKICHKVFGAASGNEKD